MISNLILLEADLAFSIATATKNLCPNFINLKFFFFFYNLFGEFSSEIHQNIQKARKLVNVHAFQKIIVYPN